MYKQLDEENALAIRPSNLASGGQKWDAVEAPASSDPLKLDARGLVDPGYMCTSDVYQRLP